MLTSTFSELASGYDRAVAVARAERPKTAIAVVVLIAVSVALPAAGVSEPSAERAPAPLNAAAAAPPGGASGAPVPSQAARIEAMALYERGLRRAVERRHQGAIDLFKKAIALDPAFAAAHFHLANALAAQGRYRAACAAYDETLRLEPEHVGARLAQATTLVLDGRCREARDRLREGLLAMPDDLELTHGLARLLVTCPDPDIRDGQAALELARRVYDHTPNLVRGETVGMAYAESGAFEEAARWQAALVEQAERLGDPAWVARLRVNLERYERGELHQAP